MASYLDKTHVNTALTDNTKLDLGHQSITTQDFMQLNVATIHELVPGSRIDVNMESFARLNPLPVPTFGRASMRNRAFFVPFRTIFRGWNDFITDSIHVPSDGYEVSASGHLLSSVPTVFMESLTGAFLNSETTTVDGPGLIYPADDLTVYDFIAPSLTGGYNYTVAGRQAIKLLEQLGYKLDFAASSAKVVLSAMPLLALAKVFCDWYWMQQYSNIISYDRLLAMCNYDVNAGPIQLSATDVLLILTACSYVQYDSDLFVSAWDQPNQPAVGNYSSDFKLANIDSVTGLYSGTSLANATVSGVTNNRVNTLVSAVDNYGVASANAPFIGGYVSGSSSGLKYFATPISEYLLHSLHALTDYMKRHQLAGSRAFDRYLARFGKALPAEKMNRSVYLGAAMQDIQIGDIMSTSDTANDGSGAQLGAYAGKGISYGNGHFSYSTDEFGYFIVLSSIVPATGYFQGIDPQVFRTSKLSFFTPEFDSLGVQPILAANLYIPQKYNVMTSTADSNAYDQVFGFVPRYADYKAPTCSDRLTGNFRLPSLNGGLYSDFNAADSWHLMRTFDGDDFGGVWGNCVHNPTFIDGGQDFSQYKRIFYYDHPDDPDNFTVIHNFEIAEYAPMKPLYDTYEFEDKGKKVTLDVNGVKMN